MNLFNNYEPYNPLFDTNHDGQIDWHEENIRLDFEDFINKRGVYKEWNTYSNDSLNLELDLAGLDRCELEAMDSAERAEALEDADVDLDDWDEE